MAVKQEIINLLKGIVQHKVSETSDISGKLLRTLFRAGTTKVTYTPEDREFIGPLILKSLPALGHQVFNLENSFASNSIDSTRIERSGLQFLLDDFKDFPTKPNETLEKYLEEFLIQEDVDGLDERLKNCVEDAYSDDPVRDPELVDRISRLPDTHWWFKD